MPHIDGTTGQAGGLSGVQISSVLCEDTKRMDFSARAATIPISHQSTTKIQNNEYTTAVRWSASNITDLLRSVLRPNDMPSHYITPIMPLINGYPANDIIQMQKSKPESMSRSQMLTWINRTLNVQPPTPRSTKPASKTWEREWYTASCSTTSSPTPSRSARSP